MPSIQPVGRVEHWEIYCLSPITMKDTGPPPAGHLRMARANWAIPQVNGYCAVSVPVGGAHEETLEQASRSSPAKGEQWR